MVSVEKMGVGASARCHGRRRWSVRKSEDGRAFGRLHGVVRAGGGGSGGGGCGSDVHRKSPARLRGEYQKNCGCSRIRSAAGCSGNQMPVDER